MSWQEALLLVAAPVIALAVLGAWVVTLMRKGNVVNLKLNFLGLALTIRTCGASEAECLRLRSINTKGNEHGNIEESINC